MSLNLLDFLSILLVITMVNFIFSFFGLMNLLVLCELFWINYFVYCSFLAAYMNSLIVFLLSIYVLCIATSETTVGLSLLALRYIIRGSSLNKKELTKINHLKPNIINSKIAKKSRDIV